MKNHAAFVQAFRDLHLNFSRFYAWVLTESALTLPQYTLINLLMSRGDMTMTDAAREMLITKPAVTHLTDRLEKAGLLRRKTHPGDRRAFLLELLPPGRQKVQKIQEKIIANLLKTWNLFKENDREQMVRFMNLFTENIHENLCNHQGEGS